MKQKGDGITFCTDTDFGVSKLGHEEGSRKARGRELSDIIMTVNDTIFHCLRVIY
jgi:hypothetical protein